MDLDPGISSLISGLGEFHHAVNNPLKRPVAEDVATGNSAFEGGVLQIKTIIITLYRLTNMFQFQLIADNLSSKIGEL